MCMAIETHDYRYYGISQLREAGWFIPDDTLHNLRRVLKEEDEHFVAIGLQPPGTPVSQWTDHDLENSCFCATGSAIEPILLANFCTWTIDWLGDYKVDGAPSFVDGCRALDTEWLR